MKKFLTILIASMLLLALAACGGNGNGKDEETTSVIPAPIDPADVNWWGEYSCDGVGLLNIVNYNDKGLGWSFRFVLQNGGIIEEGVAAVYPEDPTRAEFLPFEFRFNMDGDADRETIVVTGGGFAGTYARTEDAEDGGLPAGVTYVEAYEWEGDPGEGLSAYEAAVLLFNTLVAEHDDYYSPGDVIAITMTGFDFVDDAECYLYSVEAPGGASEHAVDYFDGIVYVNLGGEYLPIGGDGR